MGYTESELSVLIVDDGEMAVLNRQYRQIGHTTDVLSFPMIEGEFSDIAPDMLGRRGHFSGDRQGHKR